METIVCDTRQKLKHHKAKEEQFKAMGYNLLNSKLPIGDYALLTNFATIVDTKQNLLEVAANVGTKEHTRFRNECIKAQENNIKLVILVEGCKGIETVEDVAKWENPRLKRWCMVHNAHKVGKMLKYKINKLPPINGEKLSKIMQTMTEKYGVQWAFHPDENSGQVVIDILKGGGN